jgi:phenylacetate-CoA ligase
MTSNRVEDLARLEPILAATRSQIDALQLRRLQETVRQAYANNAHYRRKFDAVRASPDSIQSLGDLAQLKPHERARA